MTDEHPLDNNCEELSNAIEEVGSSVSPSRSFVGRLGFGVHSRSASRRRSSVLLPLAAFAVSVTVIGFLVVRVPPDYLERLWQMDPLPLALGAILYSLALCLAVLGWHLIYRVLDSRHSILRGGSIYILSLAARRLPSGLLGLAGRVYLYSRAGKGWAVTASAMGLESFVMVASGALVSLCYTMLMAAHVWDSVWLLAVLGVCMLAMLHPAALRWALGIASRRSSQLRGISFRAVSSRIVIEWLIVYSLVWVLGGAVLYAVATAIAPLPLSLVPHFLGIWAIAGTASAMFYFVPSGLGVMELALSALLSQHLPMGQAILVALTMRVFVTAGELVWAFAALAIKRSVAAASTSPPARKIGY